MRASQRTRISLIFETQSKMMKKLINRLPKMTTNYQQWDGIAKSWSGQACGYDWLSNGYANVPYFRWIAVCLVAGRSASTADVHMRGQILYLQWVYWHTNDYYFRFMPLCLFICFLSLSDLSFVPLCALEQPTFDDNCQCDKWSERTNRQTLCLIHSHSNARTIDDVQ